MLCVCVHTLEGCFFGAFRMSVDFFFLFFLWQNSVKFRPEKYDFDLYNGFFNEENKPQIH